jgi:hypothetical protein
VDCVDTDIRHGICLQVKLVNILLIGRQRGSAREIRTNAVFLVKLSFGGTVRICYVVIPLATSVVPIAKRRTYLVSQLGVSLTNSGALQDTGCHRLEGNRIPACCRAWVYILNSKLLGGRFPVLDCGACLSNNLEGMGSNPFQIVLPTIVLWQAFVQSIWSDQIRILSTISRVQWPAHVIE